MLDQLANLVKQFGKDTVVENPEVPNEHNEAVMADATKTIASGFQNVLAGGGFQNIVDLFKGGGSTGNASGGLTNLLKNPMVTMMIGYFISKLVSKYKMTPQAASQVANNLIPNTLTNLIDKTKDPNDPGTTLDSIIRSLTGGGHTEESATEGGKALQDILDDKDDKTAESKSGGGFDIQSVISQIAGKAQQAMSGGGGLMDMIKGFIK